MHPLPPSGSRSRLPRAPGPPRAGPAPRSAPDAAACVGPAPGSVRGDAPEPPALRSRVPCFLGAHARTHSFIHSFSLLLSRHPSSRCSRCAVRARDCPQDGRAHAHTLGPCAARPRSLPAAWAGAGGTPSPRGNRKCFRGQLEPGHRYSQHLT